MNKKWTKEEEDFIILNHNTMTDKELGIVLSRTAISIKNRRVKKLRLLAHTISCVQIGEKYGRLTVIALSEKRDKRGGIFVVCRCDCGNIKEILSISLRNGNSFSCGCYQRERAKEANRLQIKEGSWNAWEASCKSGAKKRMGGAIPYKLVTEEFKCLASQNCFWCEIEPRLWNPRFSRDGLRTKNDKCTTLEWAEQQWINVNGIDRVDNDHSIGYILSNCVACCFACNHAKSDMSLYNWLSYVERFQSGYTVKMLEKLEKAGIVIPPKNNP